MIRRQFIAVFMVLWFAAPLAAQGLGEWTIFSPPGGNFTIRVPATPETLATDKQTLNGKPVEIHLHMLRTSGLSYLIAWSDYNQLVDVEAELDLNRDNFIKGVSGRLTGETRISQGGIAGREFTTETANAFVISRVFVSGSRVWQAGVIVPPGTDDIKAATRFLYSLQVTPAR